MSARRVKIHRFAFTPMGTFGHLTIEGHAFQAYTVELPWMDNQRRVSCIPEGIYPLVKSRFNRGGYDCYELLEVPDREEILIHRGNTEDDLLGCIAPGMALGFVDGKWAVTSSRAAFDAFMAALTGVEKTSLTIASSWAWRRN